MKFQLLIKTKVLKNEDIACEYDADAEVLYTVTFMRSLKFKLS